MMRVAVVLFCLLAITTSSRVLAQDDASLAIAKGGVTLAGSVAFSSAGGDLYGNERLQTLAFGPSFGYFAADGIAIGAEADIALISQGGDSFHTIAVGPEFAAYFQTDSKLLPLVHGSVLLLNIGNGASETGFGFNVGAGLNVLVSESLGIDFDVSFLWERFKPSGAPDSISGNTVLFGIALVGFVH